MIEVSHFSRQLGSDDTWHDDTGHTKVTLGLMRAKCPARRRGEEVEDTRLSKVMCDMHEHGTWHSKSHVSSACQVQAFASN